MKFTLNWNITTYEATAMGGHEAPTIITSSITYGTSHGNVWRECDSYKYIYVSISSPTIINQSINQSISFPSSTKS